MLESPLFLTRVECPVCGTVNEFETIRVGAYTEGERETDFSPSFIKWRNPRYQKYHPLLFFAAACTQCHYTREFNAKFKEWSKDNHFRAYRLKVIKERHLRDLEASGSFIKMVGAVLDNERYPHETAVLKLLLAAYDELLNDHPSDLDLGRFYLRIAWMFRQLQIGPGTSSTDESSPGRDDYEKTVTDLEIWLAGWRRNIEYLAAAGDLCFRPEPSPDAVETPLADRFNEILSRAKEYSRSGDQLISEFRSLAADARAAGTVGAEDAAGNGFHEYPDFQSFLARLMTIWNGVPRDEFEARRFAARYYKNAFETGKEISHGNQTLQAAYLIAELSRQTGDHDTARQYFNTTVKMGQEYINEIRGDRTRTALARKILELALAQGKRNLAEAK